MAHAEGVAEHLDFIEGDFSTWKATKTYAGVMASQSLHHVVALEHLFDEVRRSLHEKGMFVISGIISHNGHMRWPEVLDEARRFWGELPAAYRYNQLLSRHEEIYENWDCSSEGFEGIRAQDMLPFFLERFHFHRYVGFGNLIDPFIDRAFWSQFRCGCRLGSRVHRSHTFG